MFGRNVLPARSRALFIGVGTAALAGVIGVSVVMAQGSSGGNPQQTNRQDFINQLATELGIDPSKLTDAIRSADLSQIDGYVSSGKITSAQGDKLKQMVNSAEVPPLGARPHPRFDRFAKPGGIGDPADVAQFLGTDTTTIKDALKSGQSLAQIAVAQGKTADELQTYLVGKAEQKLKDAVAAGKMTQDQADTISSKLPDRINRIINATPGARQNATPDSGSTDQQSTTTSSQAA